MNFSFITSGPDVPTLALPSALKSVVRQRCKPQRHTVFFAVLLHAFCSAFSWHFFVVLYVRILTAKTFGSLSFLQILGMLTSFNQSGYSSNACHKCITDHHCPATVLYSNTNTTRGSKFKTQRFTSWQSQQPDWHWLWWSSLLQVCANSNNSQQQNVISTITCLGNRMGNIYNNWLGQGVISATSCNSSKV